MPPPSSITMVHDLHRGIYIFGQKDKKMLYELLFTVWCAFVGYSRPYKRDIPKGMFHEFMSAYSKADIPVVYLPLGDKSVYYDLGAEICTGFYNTYLEVGEFETACAYKDLAEMFDAYAYRSRTTTMVRVMNLYTGEYRFFPVRTV